MKGTPSDVDETYDNLYNVLAHWLDAVDSVTDRKLLILHSCDLSMNKVGKQTRLLRQTASRRYTNAIDKLVWKLNHPIVAYLCANKI